MEDLSPKDDYPDDPERALTQTCTDLSAELRLGTRKLRAWVAGSRRRGLSSAARLLAVARVIVFSDGPTKPRMPMWLLRPPRGQELGLWTIQVWEVVEGEGGGLRSAGSKVFVMPRGVAVDSVSIDDDAKLGVSLAFGPEVASTLGLPSPSVELSTTRDALAKLPRAFDKKPDPMVVLSRILSQAGVRLAKSARRAPVEAPGKRRKPTLREYRALVAERLEKLRPALVADLHGRVFRYPFPPGTKELAFEIHSHDLFAMPIVGYLMDGNNGQVQVRGEDGEPVLAGNVDVLPKHEVISGDALKPFLEADIASADAHMPLLLRWFVAAWKEALRTERFPLAASISFHDGGDVVRLPSGASKQRAP